ncbi:MAG: YdcF family protein [Candidatus Doudnabacteria bacterium]|nr:YdcF family protein [Candidatus Doudnabacteria bacterium]
MHKVWRVIKWIIFCVGGLLAIDLAIVIFFGIYRPQIQPSDDIIVLGAAVNTPAAFNRSQQGLKLYEDGLAKAIVVSGGIDYPRGQSEAEYMKQAILANTAVNPPIIVEDKSYSTYENLANARALIGANSSIIIVSDDYHLARAVLLAERLGFKKVYWSAPSSSYYSHDELAYYYFREVFAIIDYLPKFVTGR